MTPERKRKRFPATNQEYFRLVVKSVLVVGGTAFAVLMLVGVFYLNSRLRADYVLRCLGLSFVFGLAVTLWRLRWLKWRDSRG